MDNPIEKTAFGIIISAFIVVLIFLGIGIWGFIQLIQWVTSK